MTTAPELTTPDQEAVMDSLPTPVSPPLPPLPSALSPDLAREIEVLRNAFLRHPKAVRLLAKQPGLGIEIPWSMISCSCIQGTVEGIIVGGLWEDVATGWDFDDHFTVFHMQDRPADGGGFVTVNGWLFGDDIEALATIPGSPTGQEPSA